MKKKSFFSIISVVFPLAVWLPSAWEKVRKAKTQITHGLNTTLKQDSRSNRIKAFALCFRELKMLAFF